MRSLLVAFFALVASALPLSAEVQHTSYNVSGLPPLRVSSEPIFYSPLDTDNWKLGFYWGRSYRARLMNAVATPWNTIGTYYDSYLSGGNLVYRAIDLPNLPISLELDFAGSFHAPEGYAEFRVTPTFRWKWFPWNNYVYTNLRVGPFGLSYATKVSDLERTQVENYHSAKLLNSTIVEWTFAPSENSPWEAFWRIDHRCGVWGTFDGVVGGTNYMTVGFRASF